MNKIWPTLYKLDSKGRVRCWSIMAVDAAIPYYRQSHGLLGGKNQTTATEIKGGKNQGKANETTAHEQCVLEAEALWKKQRDRKGYTETVPSEKPMRPMLAKDYRKPLDRKHIKFPCFVQPKLNGLRCLAFVQDGNVRLVSRQNTEWTALNHLVDELKSFPNGIYDGELYKHGPDFQKIIGAVKRDDPNELSAQIEYHVYDFVDESSTFSQRLGTIVNNLPDGRRFVRFVETKTLNTPDLLDEWHDNYVKAGYEGIMLRNKHGKYKINGRSSDLQKFKKFDDDEFEIIGAVENIGKAEGTCTFQCITKEGHCFNVMPEGQDGVREKYWQDWLSGKIKSGDMLSVKYFGYTTTDKPVPYIPIGICIRNYE
jgi:DNA ligase 1